MREVRPEAAVALCLIGLWACMLVISTWLLWSPREFFVVLMLSIVAVAVGWWTAKDDEHKNS